MKLRVGLVGLGDAWEVRHRPALRAMNDRFEVRAVCAQVALQAERAAEEFNAEAVDGYRVLTAREDIDAILMLSPQWFGPLPILAACDSGKAVYCAAALDLELEQAIKVRDRVESAGIAFMAELPRRHAAATLRLKELIATRLGKPKLLFCHRRKSIPDPHSQGPCFSALVTRDLIELVDWCRYVIGTEPTSVLGVRHDPGLSADNDHGIYRMMNLDFSQNGNSGEGPMAQISCGHYMPAAWTEAISFRPPAGLQVVCENGVAFVDLPSTLIWFDEAGRHMESLETERPVGEQLLALFHRAVTSLVRKTNDLDDAYHALSIVIGAEDSAEQGRRIKLTP
ncbi:MAG: Gfo/Idh/MocA family oxidoreductase [Planctomycetaceae bacterium]|nr:Gfo/Idh/MocA family oxidoreductase [Planctomycetaceae bacterium]